MSWSAGLTIDEFLQGGEGDAREIASALPASVNSVERMRDKAKADTVTWQQRTGGRILLSARGRRSPSLRRRRT
ncbi:hypothetical protein [Streptomyces sp. NBC_00893]|uniref:hypothetical protein n=1 Tax=Streptomyces sp. NBC_00893 TaxID=2975862 RepID=UPI00225224CA|nr:hypothetical protein [Streptomyces sp. NBC_00893]MCX4847112.1 hypothetical protein [Streptomyces sp. NBC_00893]